MTHYRPIVGNWYQDTDAGCIFEVVAYDEEDETIEVQHLDGEVEEYEIDSWKELRLSGIAPPEDWRLGFELSQEDAGDPDEPLHPDDWSGALNQIEPDQIGVEDDWAD